MFLSHEGTLCTFMGAYTGTMQGVHTRAYRLDEQSGTFEKLGSVIADGFWPMQQPLRMENGNWIMAGLAVGNGNSTAVAISRAEDLQKWDMVRIPLAEGLGKVWGESHPRASLSYPFAVEHAGHLYVGYSNNGSNTNRLGTGRELWNNNSAELAIIPLTLLQPNP